MLNVTEPAANLLHKTLEHKAEDDGILRLTRSGEGLGLVVDMEKEGDQIVAHDGRNVLAVDPDLSRELEGVVMDLVEAPEGPRLAMTAPDA